MSDTRAKLEMLDHGGSLHSDDGERWAKSSGDGSFDLYEEGAWVGSGSAWLAVVWIERGGA